MRVYKILIFVGERSALSKKCPCVLQYSNSHVWFLFSRFWLLKSIYPHCPCFKTGSKLASASSPIWDPLLWPTEAVAWRDPRAIRYHQTTVMNGDNRDVGPFWDTCPYIHHHMHCDVATWGRYVYVCVCVYIYSSWSTGEQRSRVAKQDAKHGKESVAPLYLLRPFGTRLHSGHFAASRPLRQRVHLETLPQYLIVSPSMFQL